MSLETIITGISVLGAIISPIVINRLNNEHQLNIKKLDYQEQREHERILHERDVFEKYIHAAGACIRESTSEDYHEFSAWAGVALYYAPQSLQKKMILLEQMISEPDNYASPAEQTSLLNEIILELKKNG